MNFLIGSHGTGKTTLLEEIKKQNPRIYVTDGYSRPIKTIKNKFNLSDDLEHQIINELTKWNWLNNKDNQYYISTRSIIDSIVYSDVLGFSRDGLESCFLEYNTEKQNYFYIPIEFELQKDGVRYEDKGLQKEIDKAMLRFLKENNIEYKIIKGTLSERTELLLKYLPQF